MSGGTRSWRGNGSLIRQGRAAFTRCLLVPGVIALLVSAAGAATTTGDPRGSAVVTWIEPTWQSWDLESTTAPGTISLSQFRLPVALTVPINERFDLVAFGAWSRNELTRADGEAVTLSGITDLRLKAAWRPQERYLVSLGIGLPAGHETLRQGVLPEEGDEEFHEVEVAQLLWAPILGFASKRMGEGLTIEGALGYATMLSPTMTLGAGAGMVVKQEYDLFETVGGRTSFDPGHELSASIGLDVRPSATTSLHLELAGRAWGEDQVAGRPSYQAAPQVEMDAVLRQTRGRWRFGVAGRGVLRGDDEVIAGGSGDAIRTKVAGGNAVFGRGEVWIQAGALLAPGLVLELASFGVSEALLADGTTFGVGPSLAIGGNGGTRGEVAARFRSGDAEGGSIDLSGVDVSVSLRVGLP